MLWLSHNTVLDNKRYYNRNESLKSQQNQEQWQAVFFHILSYDNLALSQSKSCLLLCNCQYTCPVYADKSDCLTSK